MKKVIALMLVLLVLSMSANAVPGKGAGKGHPKQDKGATALPKAPDQPAASGTLINVDAPAGSAPVAQPVSPGIIADPIAPQTGKTPADAAGSTTTASGQYPIKASVPDDFRWISTLVYVALDKDVAGTNDTVTITLDAKNTKGVRRAEAVFLAPDRTYKLVVLALTRGSQEYGTWSANITGLMPGRYVLKYVDLYGWVREPMTWPVRDRAFFVVNGSTNNGNLALLYAVLEKNRIDEPGPVAVRIDAMDRTGISQAYATIESSRGNTTIVNMRIAKGDALYGTWEGIINASVPDTTYSVKSITLANKNQSRTYSISGRSIYVEAPYPELQTVKHETSAGKWLSSLPASQFFPTIIGFSIAGFILAFYRRSPEKQS